MPIKRVGPAWAGWFFGAFVWAGISVLWSLGDAADDTKPWLIGLAALVAVGNVGRGIVAYVRRDEPQEVRGSREDTDWPQLLILTLVAAVVVASVVLGFEVLALLSGMQR